MISRASASDIRRPSSISSTGEISTQDLPGLNTNSRPSSSTASRASSSKNLGIQDTSISTVGAPRVDGKLRSIPAWAGAPDTETSSQFQVIAGTNSDFSRAVAEGRFRDDLFARLNLWTFSLPGLADRREDIAPNLDYELDRFAAREGIRTTFNNEARERYLAFAAGPDGRWSGNFRDLAASVTPMATLSPKGRIDAACVEAEIARLKRLWSGENAGNDGLDGVLTPEQLAALDPFDRVQLGLVVATCRRSRSLSDAGRILFAAARAPGLRQRCRPAPQISRAP